MQGDERKTEDARRLWRSPEGRSSHKMGVAEGSPAVARHNVWPGRQLLGVAAVGADSWQQPGDEETTYLGDDESEGYDR